jgi:hypothetical protein
MLHDIVTLITVHWMYKNQVTIVELYEGVCVYCFFLKLVVENNKRDLKI